MSNERGKINRITGQDDALNLGLDEIVGTDVNFHIERLDKGAFWFGVESADELVNVWMYAKGGKIIVSHIERIPREVLDRTGPRPEEPTGIVPAAVAVRATTTGDPGACRSISQSTTELPGLWCSRCGQSYFAHPRLGIYHQCATGPASSQVSGT